MTPSTAPLRVDTMAQLKAMRVSAGDMVFMAGRDSAGDGRGAFYRWDPTSEATTDSMLNAIMSDNHVVGRWVRVVTRARIMSNGKYLMNGGMKTYITSALTDADGWATLYLTDDGTINGNALFTDIWVDIPVCRTPAGRTVNDSPSLNETVISADKKTIRYRYTRGNPQTLGATLGALLGVLITPFRWVPAGSTVTGFVIGI